MSDFTKDSNFNPLSNFKSVRIGADAPLLEVELNELQDISEHRYKELVKAYQGDGINGDTQVSYTDGLLTLVGGKAFVDGYTLSITTLKLPLVKGEKAYLKVRTTTLTSTDAIPLHGNLQETTLVPNTMLDSRVGRETSRRIQVQYDLVKNTTDTSAKYLYLGIVDDYGFALNTNISSKEQRQFITHIDVGSSPQQVFSLPYAFMPNTNAIIAYINGIAQQPTVDFNELNNSQVMFNTAVEANSRVMFVYTKMNYASKALDTHAHDHTITGNDPLDINDLADRNGIYQKMLNMLQVKNIDGGNFTDDYIIDGDVYDGGFF